MRERRGFVTRHQPEKPRATIIGAGKFGHAVASIVSRHNIPTHLITRSETRVEQIRQRLSYHSRMLSVHKFGDRPLADIVFLALPSNDLPEIVSRLSFAPDIDDTQFVLLSKGLTYPAGQTPLELVSQTFGAERAAVVSGPSLADELLRRETHLAVASSTEDLREYVAGMLEDGNVHTHVSDDPVGIEWAGIAKNVATLGFHARLAASGSHNDAGAFAAELYSEIWQYAATQGAQAHSFIGIAGVGDLLTTSHAPTSRNVRAGQLLGKGHSVGEIEARIKQTVESFHTIPLLSRRILSPIIDDFSQALK